MMDQRLHGVFHLGAGRRRDLAVVHLDRAAGHPLQALLDDLDAFAHFGHAHEIAGVAIAVLAHDNAELHLLVDVVGLRLAQVPGDATGAQVGPRESPVEGLVGGDHPDVHGALLEDPVLGQQGLAIIDETGEVIGPPMDVLGQPGWHVEGDAARAEIVHVHARAAYPLAELHQPLAFLEAPQHGRHGAHVHGIRAHVEDVAEDAPDFGVEHADVLGPGRHLDPEKLLHGKGERVLLVLRGDVVEAVEIGYRLEVTLVLDKLFRAPVQEPDVGVGALDDLAVHLQHQAQHAVGGGMLRPEVEGEVLDLGLGHQASPSAFSSPGRTPCTPSQGLRKSKVRNSWVSFTGS